SHQDRDHHDPRIALQCRRRAPSQEAGENRHPSAPNGAKRLLAWGIMASVKLFVMFLLVLLLIGGGLKLAGMQLPVLDYPLGGPMAQPRIVIQQPNLNVP